MGFFDWKGCLDYDMDKSGLKWHFKVLQASNDTIENKLVLDIESCDC